MKALVTGASGFIGSHVARALLAHGYQVRALLRPSTGGHRRAKLPADVEEVNGDLLDVASLIQACRGCQVLIHVGALYDLWAPDPRRFYEVNVGGTQAVLDAAKGAALERVVYTSSVATITPSPLPSPLASGEGTESAFADPGKVHSHYKRSKILAEGAALRHFADIVVVNPSTPVGWGDVRPTPTGKIVLDFLRGRMPAYINTGLNLVDVEDVAEGHVLALERGQTGERYILGNENVTLQTMLQMLAGETGRKAPGVRLPLPLALAAGAVSEVLEGRLWRRAPAVPFEGVRMAALPMYYDATKARRELGLPQTPISAALRKAAAWFETNGYA